MMSIALVKTVVGGAMLDCQLWRLRQQQGVVEVKAWGSSMRWWRYRGWKGQGGNVVSETWQLHSSGFLPKNKNSTRTYKDRQHQPSLAQVNCHKQTCGCCPETILCLTQHNKVLKVQILHNNVTNCKKQKQEDISMSFFLARSFCLVKWKHNSVATD